MAPLRLAGLALLPLLAGCARVCPEALSPRPSRWRCGEPGCFAQRCTDPAARRELSIYRFTTSRMGLEVNSYVIRGGESAIMIDAGYQRSRDEVERELARLPFPPRQIKLLVLTHGHFDHIGGARAVVEATGARVVVHELDELWPRVGTPLWPKPTRDWGRFMRGLLYPVRQRSVPPVPVTPIGDQGLSLAAHGLPGRILFTPGHTAGTVSVLLESGDAFVGDLAMNVFFLCASREPCLPSLSEDLPRVRRSLAALLRRGATTFHLGHGPPISAATVRGLLAR